jgi:subtilase-type serine protease
MRKVIAIAFFLLPAFHAPLAAAQFAPGTEFDNQPALTSINASPAYRAGLSGAGVRLGLVDSGINPNHGEFSGAIIAGFDAITGLSGTRAPRSRV